MLARCDFSGVPFGGKTRGGAPLVAVLVNVAKRNRVYIQAFLLHDRSRLRVMYHAPSKEPLPDDLSADAAPGRSPLPTLQPPAGLRLHSSLSGGGGRRWSSSAEASTQMAPMELEAHLATQVQAAGWGRLSGSADGFFAWSSWLRPAVPPDREWRGTLVVLAAFPGERSLSFTAELVR